jgi:hypothetical protein
MKTCRDVSNFKTPVSKTTSTDGWPYGFNQTWWQKFESQTVNHMTWHISSLTTQMRVSVLCCKWILKPLILWHKVLLLLMKCICLGTNIFEELDAFAAQMLVPTNLHAFTSQQTAILTHYHDNLKTHSVPPACNNPSCTALTPYFEIYDKLLYLWTKNY